MGRAIRRLGREEAENAIVIEVGQTKVDKEDNQVTTTSSSSEPGASVAGAAEGTKANVTSTPDGRPPPSPRTQMGRAILRLGREEAENAIVIEVGQTKVLYTGQGDERNFSAYHQVFPEAESAEEVRVYHTAPTWLRQHPRGSRTMKPPRTRWPP